MTKTVCVKNADWVVAWDASSRRHAYLEHGDVVFTGDMLTFGAYIALLVNVHYAWPLVPAVLIAHAACRQRAQPVDQAEEEMLAEAHEDCNP